MPDNANERKRLEKEHLKCAQELSRLNVDLQNTLKHGVGPVTQNIENTLRKHYIEKKSWHGGGTFLGNHCNMYMQPDVYTDVTKNICDKTSKLTKDTKIIQAANQIKNTFDTLNSSFSKLHKQISHTRKIDPSEHDSIQENINTYMTNYRNYFPAKVLPKMHILEHHCLPFIENFGFGLGLMGEQGV